MLIELYLDAKGLTNNQSLVILDDNGKRWDVLEALTASQDAAVRSRPKEIILERWRVELSQSSTKLPPDLGAILPTVYKKSIVLFRSLFTYSKFLPAWKLARRNGKMRTNPALRIRYRIREAQPADQASGTDGLTVPLHAGSGKVVETYSFGATESPAGPFAVQVTYRISSDFRVDDSEALLSSRFMGADDEFFRPSLPTEESSRIGAQEPGSLPVGKRGLESPDRAQAYGSLSTFHQIGPTTGASPISTLRAARELGTTSPSPSTSPPPRLLPAAKIGPVGRAAVLAGEGSAGMARRPSVSFQPFKAPALSASPSLADPSLGSSPRMGAGRPIPSANLNNVKSMPPPTASASSNRKTLPDQAIASSASSSPKPAPLSRYSSSFSHRRGRLSSGGTNRLDDDGNSSGKASATSSSAQPGSGILAEVTGTSGDSLQTDDENISDFLKMLDLRKDLLTPAKAAAVDAATRRTSAALTRFQRMRDSNAALSESMSSSLLLHRSSASSSRQLSSVPPMVAGTSLSTASSPGKPISPHTPHTPAIPSRLSSNSIVSYNDRQRDSPRRQADVEQDCQAEDNASNETTHRPSRPGANAIDIPKSPRPFGPSYRRSSSAAQNRRITAGATGADDEEIFPFGLRSISLGAEERSHLSLSSLQRQQEYENVAANPDPQCPDAESSVDPANSSLQTSNPYRDIGTQRGGLSSGAIPTSTSSNHPYQARSSHSRGRGPSGGPQSHSSASGSLSRGTAIPSHLADRDRERDGSASGSTSGNSVLDVRRGTGYRSGSGRPAAPHTTTSFDEDEPLLFAMSDFGASRRSLEEGPRSSVGTDSGGNSTGSRRGSGRRGAGLPSFHPWQ
jgi:autophagy-related protein 13